MKDYSGWICVVFLVFLVGTGIAMYLGGCNRQLIDVKMKFTKAHVRWPDGTSGVIEIRKWKDYRDSDQIQVIDKSGKVWLFHSVNVVLEGE